MRHLRFIVSLLLIAFAAPDVTLAQPVEWAHVYRTDNVGFAGIDCFDRMNCGVVGNRGGVESLLIVTTDGGVTWTVRTIESHSDSNRLHLPPKPRAVSSPAAGVYVIGADSGVVWTTDDGGLSFRQTRLPLVGRTNSLHMLDRERGIAGGLLGLYRTHDFWNTWEEIVRPDSLADLWLGGAVVLGDTLYAPIGKPNQREARLMVTHLVDDIWGVKEFPRGGGNLHVTDDGLLSMVSGETVDSITNSTTSVVWLSSDRGDTWTKALDTLLRPETGLINAVFADRRFGAAGGRASEIWSTSDGGITWTRDTIANVAGPEQSFGDIVCFSDGVCLASMGTNVIAQRRPLPGGATDERSRHGRISVVPNPATADFDVRFEGILPLDANPVIVDVMGRVLHVGATREERGGGTTWRFDGRQFATGRYSVSIQGCGPAVAFLIAR